MGNLNPLLSWDYVYLLVPGVRASLGSHHLARCTGSQSHGEGFSGEGVADQFIWS